MYLWHRSSTIDVRVNVINRVFTRTKYNILFIQILQIIKVCGSFALSAVATNKLSRIINSSAVYFILGARVVCF